jgi:hypothetical protein
MGEEEAECGVISLFLYFPISINLKYASQNREIVKYGRRGG